MSLKSNNRRLSFTTVRVVREVMASKSLTKTAKNLKITQPAVSLHLRRFEETIGFSPVVRVGNQMIVTSEDIEKVLDGLISLENELLRFGKISDRRLKACGVCQYWGIRLVTDLDASKRLRNRFLLHVDCTDQLWKSYIDGDIDVIIRPVLETEDPLFSVNLPLVWAGGSPTNFNGGSEQLRVILARNNSAFGRTARKWLELNRVPYKVLMECSNPAFLGDLCKNLDATTLVPATFARSAGLSIAESLMGKSTSCQMKVGLFFRESSISFSEAEDCFRDFLALVDTGLSYLRAAS